MPDQLSTIDLIITGTLAVAPAALGLSKAEEVPFACDLAAVEASLGTAGSANPTLYDILKNGVSLFAAGVTVGSNTDVNRIAVIAPASRTAQGGTGGAVTATDTTFSLELPGNVSLDLKQGAYLKIENEYVQINAPITGSPKVDGAQQVFTVPVARAQLSSTAAPHAANTPLYAQPVVPATQTKGPAVTNPAESNTPTFAAGDTAQLSITAIGTGAADMTATLLLAQR
jgi:hypothetical protein